MASMLLQELLRVIVFAQQSQEKVLRADVGVLEPIGVPRLHRQHSLAFL
jgi:hypothetical protein